MVEVPQLSYPDASLARQFSEEALASTVFLRRGTLPVVITVPHDGTLTSIGGAVLSPNIKSKRRDLNVRVLAREAYLSNFSFRGPRPSKPTLIIDRVNRAFRTMETKRNFGIKVMETVSEIASEFHPNGQKVLCLDLHGFVNQPSFGRYDFILGTGNRKTLRGTDVDLSFAEFMEKRGYSVYVPSEVPKEGEKFGATDPGTLIQRIHQLALPNVVGMQIEIAQHLRDEKTKHLSVGRDLGEFIATWAITVA